MKNNKSHRNGSQEINLPHQFSKNLYSSSIQHEWPRRNVRAHRAQVDLVSLEDVPDETIEVLFPGLIFGGQYHALVGAPASGKSHLIAEMIAHISNTVDGVVIIFNNEDSDSRVRSRLQAAGANSKNIKFIGEYRKFAGCDGESFSMGLHGDIFRLEIEQFKRVSAIFFDNIGGLLRDFSVTSKGIREGFESIKDIVEKHHCAVVCVTHFGKGFNGKNALNNVVGGAAVTQYPRVVISAQKVDGEKTKEGAQLYALIAEKESVEGRVGSGQFYTLEEVSIDELRRVARVKWGRAFVDRDDEPLLNHEKQKKTKRSAAEVAQDFVKQQLRDGPLLTTVLEARAADAGIAKRTLERARADTGVSPVRSQGDGRWWVRLPDDLINGIDDDEGGGDKGSED